VNGPVWLVIMLYVTYDCEYKSTE